MKSYKNNHLRRPLALLFVCAAFFLFLTGCQSYYQVQTTADIETNFSRFQTYAWLPDELDSTGKPFNNEIIRNNIKNYFGRSLLARGLAADLESPDLLLKLSVIHIEREGVVVTSTPGWHWHGKRYYDGSRYHNPYPSSYYYKHHRGWFFPPTVVAHHFPYDRGTLTLSVYDRQLKKMIWQGSASVNIYEHTYINRDVHPAVEAIMKKFPIRPVQKGSNKAAS